MRTMKYLTRFSTWMLTTIGLAFSMLAQESATAPAPQGEAGHPPRIGLALEGGAALGLAHIGVLKWMEEHRVPISYVAGTSMGGLVGGFYATGMRPKEINTVVEAIHWNDVLRGEIGYRDLTFRRKEDETEFPTSLEFGLRHGVSFPSGFNSGQEVGLILDRVSLPYSDVTDFNDLPTPFACVATDLVTGKQFVFRKGSLSQALRATMSLPGIFTPVRTDDHVLVDGGLLDNLPTEVAKKMGADIVIGVHLQVKQMEAKEPLSAAGVLGRSISVVIAANELRGMEKADVLLVAELADFGSGDYARAEDIIQKGYEAAASKASVLSALSVDEATWAQYLEHREQKRRTTPVPQFVEVTGTSPQVASEIKEVLASDIGKPVDTTQMSKSLTMLAGGGRFSRLDYGLVERDGQTGLLIEAQEKTYSPPSVRPVVIIDGSDYLNVRFKIGARITFLDFGKYGAELRNDVVAGSSYGISTEYYRPFGDNTKWFVAPKGFANTSEFDLYDDNSLVAEYRNRLLGGALDIGYAINRQSEARFGYEIADQNLKPQVGDPHLLPSVEGRIGITSLRYNYIGTDNPVVPRKGWNIFWKSAWQDANPAAPSGFPFVEADVSVFQPITKPASLFFEARGGTTFGHDDTGIPPFSLGGPTNLSAYGTNELLNNQFFLFRTGYIREIGELPPLLGDRIYLVGTYEIGKAYGVPNSTAFQTDVAGALVINTIFGPITFGGAIGDSGHHKFFFGMGRVF